MVKVVSRALSHGTVGGMVSELVVSWGSVVPGSSAGSSFVTFGLQLMAIAMMASVMR